SWVLRCSCFFFSSRRRHTSCYRDWSSDVCSSDLLAGPPENLPHARAVAREAEALEALAGRVEAKHRVAAEVADPDLIALVHIDRSEERRVGKEGRTPGERGQQHTERAGRMRRGGR